jgi:hypothetical protein
MIMKEKKVCLSKGCEKKAKTRGLCPSCYNSANHIVKSGETSWDQLEEMGLSLPSSGREIKSAFRLSFEAMKDKPKRTRQKSGKTVQDTTE